MRRKLFRARPEGREGDMKIFIFWVSILFGVLSSYGQNTSVYTDLADTRCKTIESTADEGGSYRGICPGVGGYKLEVIEGDLRQSINVIAKNGKKHELNLWNVSGGGFSSV